MVGCGGRGGGTPPEGRPGAAGRGGEHTCRGLGGVSGDGRPCPGDWLGF